MNDAGGRGVTPDPELSDNFIAALKTGQFILYAQAIKPISAAAGKLAYQEILVRFQEEEDKLLPPGGFFPLLEQHGLMPTLDKWVINRVVRWLRARRKAAPRAATIPQCTINVSIDSFTDAAFAEFVAGQLSSAHVPPGNIHFEVSEEELHRHELALDAFIVPLKPLGCQFVVTGYTGERVPVDMLQALGIGLVKIEGRIVRRIHEDRTRLADARAIHEACQGIGARTIAELVEQQATLDALKTIGVDFVQGYGVARPAPLK